MMALKADGQGWGVLSDGGEHGGEPCGGWGCLGVLPPDMATRRRGHG